MKRSVTIAMSLLLISVLVFGLNHISHDLNTETEPEIGFTITGQDGFNGIYSTSVQFSTDNGDLNFERARIISLFV